MKVLLASLAAAGIALSCSAAFAQVDDSNDDSSAAVNPDQSFEGVDTDNNGGISWAEFSLAFTDITEEQFNMADADANGELSSDEFDTLVVATGSIEPMEPAEGPAAPNQSLTYVNPDDRDD